MLLRGLGAIDLSVCDSVWTAPLCCYDWYRNMATEKCAPFIAAVHAEFPEPPAPAGPPVPPLDSSGRAVDPNAAAIVERQTAENLQAQFQKFMDQLGANLNKPAGCSWYQSKATDGTCHAGGTFFWLALIGGGLVVAGSLKGFRRKR